jgi:hypothetical protein
MGEISGIFLEFPSVEPTGVPGIYNPPAGHAGTLGIYLSSHRGRLLTTGYRLLTTGYRLLTTGYRLLTTGYRLLATGYFTTVILPVERMVPDVS